MSLHSSSFFYPFLLFSFLPVSIASSSCLLDGPISPTAALVDFLVRVQFEALKTLGPTGFDPKVYVDLPIKVNLTDAEKDFANLKRVDGVVPLSSFQNFLDTNFGDPNTGLKLVDPRDFVPEPEGFLPKVNDPKVKAWALQVHALWKILSRQVSDEVIEQPDRFTLLPLPEPMIIPGSRFKEVYYWDSYWIIRGLLVSKMIGTAKSVANNLLWMVEQFGYPLNGARTYYINRSHPPLLSSMIMEIFKYTDDLTLVNRSLPLLLKEYELWISEIHNVRILDLEGKEHSLARYYATWNTPRPESATIDEEAASKIQDDADKAAFYRQVSSGAETGWDFSSRWMSNPDDITTLKSTMILPVDLNIFLQKMELDIATFAQLVGDNSTSERFVKASKAREEAIAKILWNESLKQWNDYWLEANDCNNVHKFVPENQNRSPYVSNFIPMWMWKHTTEKDEAMVEAIRKSFEESGLLGAAGIATSLKSSGQQWDYPNGWAPLQHLIIEGLANSGSKKARDLAEDIAIKWLKTNYGAFKSSGAMHEKYETPTCGKIGSGGEYAPQTGFGWSNGVLLALLEEFGWPFDRHIECEN